MPHIDPRQLNDLAALAARGGLGIGTATTDCVAEEPDQLMFIKGDQLVLLREMEDVILASCEGVVGWVKKGEVEFEQVASGSTPSSPRAKSPRESLDVPRDGVPRTILTAPSPPPQVSELPEVASARLDAPRASKRISGPFDFESPQQSPSIDQDAPFFQSQRYPANPSMSKLGRDSDQAGEGERADEREQVERADSDENKRESVTSIASSEALGGIGGFMMGDSGSEDGGSPEGIEELRDDISPATASIETPHSATAPSSHSTLPPRPASPESDIDDSDWDIYGDYARESMYAPLKRISLAAKRASKMPRQNGIRDSTDSINGIGAVHAARAALEGTLSPLGAIVAEGRRRPTPLDLDSRKDEEATPKAEARVEAKSPVDGPLPSRSIATELRLRIQKEREREMEVPKEVQSASVTPGMMSPERSAENSVDGHDDEEREIRMGGGDVEEDKADLPARPPRSDRRHASPAPTGERVSAPEEVKALSEPGHGTDSKHASDVGHGLESDESSSTVHLKTPQPDGETVAQNEQTEEESAPPSLMASPMPFDDGPKVAEPLEIPSPDAEIPSPALNDIRLTSPFSPAFAPPKPPGWSPNLGAPHQVWSPGSPASPHSIAATRHAVEAVKATPEGRRPRGLTLVGRMEADLSASKGPVPITFLIGGPNTPGMSPTASPSMSPVPSAGIGLGFPSASSGRKSPVTPETRARSPLSPHMPPIPPMPDDLENLRAHPSKYPQPTRSVTSPIPTEDPVAGPRNGFLAARPRSRSFSSSVAKAITKKTQPLSIVTTPPVPSIANLTSPSTTSLPSKRNIFGRKSSPKHTPPASPVPMARSTTSTSTTASQLTLHPNSSAPSLPPPSARSSSFSFTSKGSKTPKKMSRALPSPVSHKDFEDTVNAGGMDFELVQPKKVSTAPGSPMSMHSSGAGGAVDDERMTMTSAISVGRIVPDTDEWGFVKESSPVPEIFMSRAAPGEHRANEQKWLGIIATPLPASGPPKKVRKLVLDHGIPSSLRGRVWAWFMAGSLSARVPGLYDELCGHDRPSAADDQIDNDVASLWSDHSIFHAATAPGRADLRSLLRAYSNFAPSGYSTPMCHVAGTLLIHCVAEDAFWLLSGLVNTALKEYYVRDGVGLRVDSGVLEGVIKGSERDLAGLFKTLGIRASEYIETWYKQLFVRCLPWPTTLRVIDAVVSEGPRFLFVAALTILTLSKDRLMALPRTKDAVLDYLRHLPQDSLLLPDNFMKACEKVRFREEDYRRLRGAVEKEMGLA